MKVARPFRRQLIWRFRLRILGLEWILIKKTFEICHFRLFYWNLEQFWTIKARICQLSKTNVKSRLSCILRMYFVKIPYSMRLLTEVLTTDRLQTTDSSLRFRLPSFRHVSSQNLRVKLTVEYHFVLGKWSTDHLLSWIQTKIYK